MKMRNPHALILVTTLGLAIVLTDSLAEAQGRGGPGFRGGRSDAQFLADREDFQYLLAHRGKIRREVTKLRDGVLTITESDDEAVAARITEHVSAMHRRIREHEPIHRRDPLFDALFQHADKIKMKIEETEKGVRVTETSDDPNVARLIQAHAKVVSLFVKYGHLEVRRNHAAPAMDN